MAIWERIWRANCAVAVFGGRAGTHGACKPGCGMGTPLRKATAQKRAPRIFSRGKQTGPGSTSRRGIGGGLRAGRAAAVWRATLPVLWRIGQDAMCSVCHCPPLASRPETQWARYGFTDRAAVSLRATLPVLRRTGRDAGAFPRQANQTGVSTSSRDRRRLARRPCSCCPARHPARILVLRWSAQDAAAEPYEYALDCASDRKAYAWPPLPRTPHPRLTRWQRAFYHPFLWRTLCYGKRLCGQGNGKAQALQRGRRERCQSGRAAHKGAARNHDGAQQKRLANAPA